MLPLPAEWMHRRQNQISVIIQTGEWKVSEKSAGDETVFDFRAFAQPSESLCGQERDRSIACRRGWIYVVGGPGGRNGNPANSWKSLNWFLGGMAVGCPARSLAEVEKGLAWGST